MRSSTRARRQVVVGPTPKPRCRRQCGNTARATALGLGSPPPSVKDGTGQGSRGSPAPDRTSARSGLRVGAADRPTAAPLRSPLSLQGERRVREGVFSHPRYLPPAASQVRGGHAQPYVRTRRGHPAKERRGPRRVDMHGQVAPTRKDPAAYLWSSWTAARYSHRELGRRRGHLEPAAGALPSWQAVSTSLTRALGGGEPFRPLVA